MVYGLFMNTYTIPTFDEVLAKAKDNKNLNDLEVLVFVGEFTLVANKVDFPEKRELMRQGITCGFAGMIIDKYHNKSAMYYWYCLYPNVRNIVVIHKHLEATLLHIILP